MYNYLEKDDAGPGGEGTNHGGVGTALLYRVTPACEGDPGPVSGAKPAYSGESTASFQLLLVPVSFRCPARGLLSDNARLPWGRRRNKSARPHTRVQI